MLSQLNSAPILLFPSLCQRVLHIIIVPTETELLVKRRSIIHSCLVRTQSGGWFVRLKSTQTQSQRQRRDLLLIHRYMSRPGGRPINLRPDVSAIFCRNTTACHDHCIWVLLKSPCIEWQTFPPGANFNYPVDLEPLISAEMALRCSGRQHFHLLGIG